MRVSSTIAAIVLTLGLTVTPTAAAANRDGAIDQPETGHGYFVCMIFPKLCQEDR